MKLIYFFYFCFLFISCVSGLEFRASPEEIIFDCFVNEVVCKNISFYASENVDVKVEDRWASIDFMERNLVKHSLSVEDLDIEIDYLNEFNIDKKNIIEVCVVGENVGLYHGVMLARVNESQTGIGIWLKINISKNSDLINLISSNVVKKINSNNFVNKHLSSLVGFLVLILVIQFFILLKRKL